MNGKTFSARRRALVVATGAAAVGPWMPAAAQPAFPSRPIRLLVPFPPGVM